MSTEPDDDETPTDQTERPLGEGLRGTTAVGLYRTAPDGELLDANEALLEMFGCDSFAELRRGGLAAFHLDGRPEDHRLRAIARDGEARGHRGIYRRSDGRTVHVRESVHPVLDDEGDVRWYEGTMEDVTDLVGEKEMLSDDNARLRAAVLGHEATLDAVAVGVLVVDAREQLVDQNDRFLEIWDLPEEELRSGDAGTVFDLLRDRLADPGTSLDPAASSASLLELVDGRILERTVEPRRGDGVEGRVWSFRDVTEQARARRRLERSNRDLERFASGLSHDLREPIRTVTSFLDLLERRLGDDLDGEARELFDHARGGAERAAAMTESLLRLSRVQSRDDPLAPTDLDAALGTALDHLQLRIRETGAEVAAGDLPVVEGDADQLAELLQNLVENAIKYTPADGTPRIEISAEERGDDREIRVTDEGRGMDETTADAAFGVFERGADTRDTEGTGMGLAICERIVDRHGGRIWIEETAPGEGTTVAFTLRSAGGR